MPGQFVSILPIIVDTTNHTSFFPSQLANGTLHTSSGTEIWDKGFLEPELGGSRKDYNLASRPEDTDAYLSFAKRSNCGETHGQSQTCLIYAAHARRLQLAIGIYANP